MHTLQQRLAKAARDYGLACDSPCVVKLANNRVVQADAHVHQTNRAKGILVFGKLRLEREVIDEISELGYDVSFMSDSVERYDAEQWKSVLVDWCLIRG